jgi:spore coat polysaccharide biosynthesis protein SpsF (cytidylyltransferase family)/predicted dehydrogenase
LKIGCLLSVREKATRLPKKVLLDLAGKPLTVRLLHRLAMARGVDQVILSTSSHPDDEVLAILAEEEGFAAFRGSEEDKLDRYYQTALHYGLDAVIVVDGDDPFCFPEAIDLVAAALHEGNVDCVYLSGLPLGAASTGLTTDALRRVLEMKDERDTEVWGGYFIGSGRFNSREIRIDDPLLNHPEIRLTLDYQEDYELITRVAQAFDNRFNFSSHELMDLLVNQQPELAMLNIEAQKRYESHLQKCAPVKFKEGYDEMKVMVVGLGSMGKRRVRNLIANGVSEKNIIGVDCRADRISEAAEKYGIATSSEIQPADLAAVSALVISTSPDQHLPYALIASEHGKHMFIEASVLAEGLPELADQVELKKLVAFPSCTMRFFAGPKRISELLRDEVIGDVLAWQYQSGQYLPDWHPWEPITEFYVSNPQTGGCREIVPFEMVWLEPLFGKVKDIDCRRAKLSAMPADIDDIYMLQMRHEGGVLGQLIVDVLGRTAIRHLRVTGSNGTLEWDDSTKRLRVFRVVTGQWQEETVGSGTVESRYINPEEPYIEEIRNFLECVRTRQVPAYTLRDDLNILGLLYSAETADVTGRRAIRD